MAEKLSCSSLHIATENHKFILRLVKIYKIPLFLLHVDMHITTEPPGQKSSICTTLRVRLTH